MVFSIVNVFQNVGVQRWDFNYISTFVLIANLWVNVNCTSCTTISTLEGWFWEVQWHWFARKLMKCVSLCVGRLMRIRHITMKKDANFIKIDANQCLSNKYWPNIWYLKVIYLRYFVPRRRRILSLKIESKNRQI